MKDYLNEFNSYLVIVKKSSKNTVDSYMRDVRKYCEYCHDQNIKEVGLITCDFIKDYIEYLETIGKSETTQTRIISSLKCYYNFLLSLNIATENPVLKIKIYKKTNKSLPIILDHNEIKKLLEQPDMSDLKGIRDKAILELLYATGIKVSELVSLNYDSINLQIGLIYLEDRVVPIYKDALKVLSLYINQVRPSIVMDIKEKKLFTNMSGTALTRQGLWKIIKNYSFTAGIKKDITPHTLRHSFAAHLLENGANLEDIKALLGFSDISSTQIYTKIIADKYTSKYQQFHPFAKR